jgi:hypothetical protein
MSVFRTPSKNFHLAALLSALFLMTISGCATAGNVRTSQAFTIAQNQKMVPILPFANILVPESFSTEVFNDYVDNMNDSRDKTGFSLFAIMKDDLKSAEKVLSPAHIYVSGEIWSYIEDSGCCSTALRVKSRLRIYRVNSRELLWEAEIPMESFFEHDSSTLDVERLKLGKRLSSAMSQMTIKALQDAKRISIEE